jgi:precorrin-2/cobalt-factor-2 C20-methyltransferase
MTGGESAQPGYDAAAAEIGARLDRGQDVAVLCEGDPLFYGSFTYLLSRLAGRYPVAVVPGVTSLTACAAAVPVPLVGREERLLVMPAGLGDETLAAGIAAADTIALVKVSRHGPRLRALLARLELLERAWYVERASQTAQRVVPLAGLDPASATYFAIILIVKEAASWR